MSKQVSWNLPILEEFIRIGCLNEIEEKIIRKHALGYSIDQIAISLDYSRSTVNYYISRLKLKYDEAEKYSKILPPRKKNRKELWNHKVPLFL